MELHKIFFIINCSKFNQNLIMLIKVFSNIIKISSIQSIRQFSFPGRPSCINFFSQQNKIDVLKTYLQIIPPHQIHNMIQQKENKLNNLIKKAQKLNQKLDKFSKSMQKQNIFGENEQKSKQAASNSKQITSFQQEYFNTYKQIYKYVKSKSPYVPIQTLSDIISTVSTQTNSNLIISKQQKKQIQYFKRKTYLKIIRQFKYKSESLPLEDLVNFVYKLAKLNINDYEVMKAAQNSIIQQKLKINYPFLRKILWAFTHLDVGSSVLYTHISKTLKMGQFQIEPLQLAQSAYMLSKVSQNARGGYGVFQIAQKQIQANLPRMKFDQLTKVSHYMLTQNIGTNEFQFKLEAQLEKKYPDKDKLPSTDFITLLKATSAYYFKFKDKALFNLLKTSTVRQAKNTTLQQFQDIVWSWGRLGKGDLELWDCIQGQIKRRIAFLKPRQISFFYHAVSSTTLVKQEIIDMLEQKFCQLPLQKINQHYLIKMLLGMQKQKKYNQNVFLKISQQICNRIGELSKNQLLSFFKVLNESDYDYINKKPIENIITSLNEAGKKHILKSIYTLKISQITEILYTYIKFEINNPQLINLCFMSLSQVINIPKTSFIKALFCFTIKDNYQKSYKMMVILQELLQYGPIGYFFSPYQFPLLAYSILHMHYNSKGAIEINRQLVQQTQQTLRQINPVILNEFVKKGYDQAMRILSKNQQKNNKKNDFSRKRNKNIKKQ